MRAWLFVLAVLATFKEIVQVASTDNFEPDKLEQIEKSLISLLGMERRPKIVDRTKIVIPDELQDIFNEMMTGHYAMDSVSLPMPGVHAKSANTIRCFQHEGKQFFFKKKIDRQFFIFCAVAKYISFFEFYEVS